MLGYLLAILSPEGAAQEEIYTVERVPFSERAYDEYAPVLYQGGIVFTANKRISYTTQRTDTEQKTALNLFIVHRLDNEGWSDPELFSEELTSVNSHHGWITFNERGNRIFFNTNLPRTGREDAPLGIFSAGFAGGEWTGIQPFPHNDPSYNIFHPYLSPDGSRLFFCSDMRSGYGGSDLYVSMLDGNTWSEPVNLGPSVNTRRHETSPVYLENGRLYFSSNGRDGLGRSDIYYTEFVEGEWVEPVHLPEPFNSRRDDVNFIPLDSEYMTGYLTSNRDRTRTMSIYEIRLDIPETLFINCKEQEKNNYCFTFFEEGSMDIDTTNFMYEWLIEGNRFRSKEANYCFAGPGEYNVQLNVIDMLSGEVMFNEATYNFGIENIEQAYISSPDTLLVDQEVVLDGTETYLNGFNTNRYVWNTGDLSYLADPVITHSYYKPGIYTVKLGVIDAESPEGQTRHTCSFKRIVVLPRMEEPVSSAD